MDRREPHERIGLVDRDDHTSRHEGVATGGSPRSCAHGHRHPEVSGGQVGLAVQRAHRPREGGHEDVVDAPAERPRRGLHRREWDVGGVQTSSQRAGGPQRRQRPVVQGELVEHRPRRLDSRADRIRQLGGVREQRGGPSDDGPGGPAGALERHPCRSRGQIDRPRGGRAHGVAGVAVGEHGETRLEVEDRRGGPEATLTVGDGVVDPLDEPAASVVDSVDDHELPQRPIGFEGLLDQPDGQVEELTTGPGGGQGDHPEVPIDVEVGVVAPRRRCQSAGRAGHALVRTGDSGRPDGGDAAGGDPRRAGFRAASGCRRWGRETDRGRRST